MDRVNKSTSPQSRFKIKCKNYPPEFNLDKTIAKEYFRQFGKLKRVLFKPKIGICIVEYVTKESFLKALNNAGDYNGNIFEVSVETTETKKKKSQKSSRPIWLDYDEVEEELKAMHGVGGGSMLLPLKKTLKPDKKKIWNLEVPVKKKPKIREDTCEIRKKAILTPEHLTLINIVLSQAQSSEDKFKVLDSRDKLLRIKLKQDHKKRSAATTGTCPDMCPEKERLMRVIQHQVALYEQDNGKSMNHKIAIKQYSRSSANQDAPLPHELRPVHILQMTMCYLMHNILDLIDTPDVNVSEWYHFLWDRTRSIRKDITQQELCCQGAVELVEQCARFHIHCSARLTGEEPSIFDQKINTENLTKCLQTLKYMYNDLQLKHEHCPNEPEFRAYVILLNMNDGNFMWEVQQLREEIQKSHEVKFALEVYSALDKNNYVKFFKLVNSTTYLNTCILMRYFIQVRTTALKILLKCYAPRATKTYHPLKELTNILGFDDVESSMDFMQFYGLPVNEEKTHIILDKSTFALPEISYVLERSYTVVESKRFHSVGRVVCGKDLPPRSFDHHVPHNSFDDKGYLISKDFLEEGDLEQASKQLIDELTKEPDEVDSINEQFLEEETHSSFRKNKSTIPHIFEHTVKPRIVNDENTNIFLQPVVTDFVSDSIFGKRKLNAVSFGEQVTSKQNQTESIFTATQTFNFGKSPSNIFGGKLEHTDEPPKVSQTNKGGFSFNLAHEGKSKSSFPLPQIPTTSFPTQLFVEASQGFSKLHQNFVPYQTNSVQSFESREDSELEQINNSEALQTGTDSKPIDDAEMKEIYKTEDVSKSNQLKEKENLLIEMEMLKRQEEQKRLNESRKRKELLNKEIMVTVKETLKSIVAQVDDKIRQEKLIVLKKKVKDDKILVMIRKWKLFVSNKRKRKAIDCASVWVNSNTSIQAANELQTPSENITLSLKKRYKYGKSIDIEIFEDEKISKINLFELTYPTIKQRFFDLTGTIHKSIYWKIVISMPDSHELMNGAQRIEDTMEQAFQWKNEKHVVEHKQLNNVESITYCIEKQKGLEVVESEANGIIFVAKNFNTVLQRRIFEHLKGFGVFTKVPIVIILQEYDKNECKLKALQDAKILSDYIILIDHLTPLALFNSVEEGLVFLASKIEMSPPLELDTFYSFIVKYLCSEMWKKANSFAKWNSQYKTCLREPNVVISLYNEALQKLTKIILDRSSKEYANFPEVFEDYLTSEVPDYLPCSYQYFPKFWKSEFYIYNLEKMLKKLSLPMWQVKWPPTTEFELEVEVAKYCTKAFKNPETVFYKTMGSFLKDIDPNVNFEDIENILWTKIIELFGSEKLNELSLTLRCTNFEDKSIFNEYIVVYNKSVVEKYRNSDWFYINNPVIEKQIKKLMHLEKTTLPQKNVKSTNIEDVNDIIEKATKKLNEKSVSVDLQKEIDDFKILMSDLETSINIHKKINLKMEEELKKAIANN